MRLKKSHPKPFPTEDAFRPKPLDNQDGSVIVLVLMVLVIMTVIGIMSSDTIVTENFVTRNMGIYKQNEALVQSALMQGLQQVMQIPVGNPDNFDPPGSATSIMINDHNDNPATNPIGDGGDWYSTTFNSRCLTAANSNDADSGGTYQLLAARGEGGLGNLRFALVGWEAISGSGLSLGQGKPIWHKGRIVAEYVSLNAAGSDNGFGLMRMELGVRQQW
jgi:hypothetical protein